MVMGFTVTMELNVYGIHQYVTAEMTAVMDLMREAVVSLCLKY